MNSTFHNSFKNGLVDGIPIGIGYLSVSIAFGLSAVTGGLNTLTAVLISMTNLTSAGQLAGLSLLVAGGSFLEMALTQLVINLRYALMSISLSQKMHKSVSLADRFLIAFGNTDEIFAVAVAKPGELGTKYMLGLILVPFAGWSLGTFVGAAAGQILPTSMVSALGIAIYAMLVAVFIPPAKKSWAVAKVVVLAVALSCVCRYVPVINSIPSGYAIILCALLAACFGALMHPVEETDAGKGGAQE